ncbi:LacI family DNA-binding transcriptional regulator [Siphonobacter curvatus]|uniref:LacI family transcriptional regulator n=1 Tax=Siphonobacter curvatus TaxID=2094562 RepID=A0A2S7IFR1_9BACT|nr:substrate-binding domain-containing protein [Siphonobacter curvatus]PQA54021.1 LacI family transcriptional regulator [Siphonobacter curvatus]
MIHCPKCHQVDSINKAGMVRGKQRYYCKSCQRHFSFADTPKPRSKHQVTIVDMARELGISKSTVSRALRDQSDIHPSTRKAVVELAQQLDYQPNLLAYGLVKSRTNTVGMIVPEFHHYFFPEVIIGTQEVLQAAGYNLMICQSNESYQTEVANVKALMASRVDGLIVSMTSETNNIDHFKALENKGTPLIFFNRICPELETHRVVVDDYEGAYRAVTHLLEQGYRRIAHIAGPGSLLISRLRQKGYTDALASYGIELDPELIITYDLTDEKARIYATYLLDLPTPPDAIFAVNDPTAIQVMLVAKAKGVRIPEELAVVGFSNDPISAIIEPGLTTVSQPVGEIGRTAARLFLETIRLGEQTVPRTETLKTELIIRGSSVVRPA